uniref:Uncharacterized protein n=1 Tax=Tanacetum cinerariifolium TaxID=118510 RepID=A0A699Q3J6_TANCI|nr:hypothetical protein [Tanacetum cinerariifolium]
MVNDGEPRVNHREPSPDHHSITAGPPVNHHRSTVFNRPGLDRIGSDQVGSGVESGRHVAPPVWATWHQRITTQPAQGWESNSRPHG